MFKLYSDINNYNYIIINCLIKCLYNINEVFINAIKYNYIKAIKLLLKDKQVNPSSYHNYAIILAAENGHLEVVKLLLKDKRVNLIDYYNYAINFACSNEHLKIVELLLRYK